MIFPSIRLLPLVLLGFIPFALSLFGGAWPFYLYILFLLLLLTLPLFMGFREGKVEVEREIPPILYFGKEYTVTVRVMNYHRFPIVVDLLDSPPPAFSSTTSGTSFRVSGYGESIFSYKVKPCLRGTHRFSNLRLLVSIPPYLTMRRVMKPVETTCQVLPDLAIIRYFRKRGGLKFLRRVPLRTRPELVPWALMEGVREYIQGDEKRDVSWKHTARRGRPMVKVFKPIREEEILLLIDCGRLSKRVVDGLPLFEYFLETAVKFSFFQALKGNRTGLLLYSKGIEEYIPPEKGVKSVRRVLSVLKDTEPVGDESDLGNLGYFLHRTIKKRALLLCFTGIPALTDPLLNLVSGLGRRHIFILATIYQSSLKEEMAKDPVIEEEIYRKAASLLFFREMERVRADIHRRGGIFFAAPSQALLPLLLNNIT